MGPHEFVLNPILCEGEALLGENWHIYPSTAYGSRSQQAHWDSFPPCSSVARLPALKVPKYSGENPQKSPFHILPIFPDILKKIYMLHSYV